MKEILTQRILFTLKYLVGFFLLAWILAYVDRKQMLATIMNLELSIIVFVIILAFVSLAAQFYRWKYLVESNSTHFRSADLMPSFFAGFAFRMMLPGGHAEITKVFLLPGKKGGKVVAFGIEKFFQTYIKIFLVSLAFPIIFPEYRLILWGVSGVLLVAYFFLPRMMQRAFLKKYQEREVNYHSLFFRTLIYSMAIFSGLILQYYYLLNSVHDIGFYETSLSVIFIWGAGLLPISVSGLGVREALSVFFFGKYGIPGSSAVGLSLFLFFINAILPAFAGVYYIIKRRSDLRDAGGVFKSATKIVIGTGKNRFIFKKKQTDLDK
ncbi:MAG: lysylphosphatidylglycerol synthase transmembrane domain-containing protein [Calditrichaceae bacterium]